MSLPFSPLRDQPHYIYTVEGPAALSLLAIEAMTPGALAYGHYHNSRQWYRLKKLDAGHPLDRFDYFRCFVPLNCAWLFEQRVNDDGYTLQVEHAINVEDIFAWPSDDPEALATMAEYGRQLVREMIADGEVREFVADFITDYQARAVYWAATRPWAKLVYPCGAGKSLSAVLSVLARRGPVAVVAPAKARRVWWDEVQRYTYITPYRVNPEGQMRKGDETLEQYLQRRRTDGTRPFVIWGSQSLPDHVHEVQALQPTNLILDELHTFGQPKRWVAIHEANGTVSFEKRKTTTDTRETRAVAAMDVSRLACLKFRIGLTATPLDDGRPRRLWAQIDLLAPGGFGMGYGGFALRYCGATPGEYGGLDDKGSSYIEELKMRAAYIMQEVTHTESHGQLPPTRVQVVWLDPSDQNRPAAFKRIITAAEKQAVKTNTVFDRERALEANLMEAASRKRKFTIEEVLEGTKGNGKVVLFTARRADCEDWATDLHKALGKEAGKGGYGGKPPQMWWGHGGTDEREREDMVADFRDHPGPCVLVGTGQAFGESINGLQTATLALFVMLPWRPGDFEQWKGRFDRLGGGATLLKVILAKRTYDEKVAGLLADKIVPIREFLHAEQYEGLGDKLMGIDDAEAMRASILNLMFGDNDDD